MTCLLPNQFSDHLQNILEIISTNPVTNVISAAGTGKTTILPKLISNSYRVIVIDHNETFKNFLHDIKVNNYDIIVIDEADNLTLDQSLIILLAIRKNIKLLLLSAFPVETNLFDVVYYQIETIKYPIEIRYSTEDLNKLVYDTFQEVEGDILIFASDRSEINLLQQSLSIPTVELDQIDKGNDKKVVIADKIAETSHLLPNVSVIIDLMKDVKKSLSLTGGTRYFKRYITKKQAAIRASRGALTKSLLVYRMVTKEFFDKLRYDEEPEILQTPVYNIMLELIDNEINPFDILDIYPRETLEYNYNLMIKLGVITPSNGPLGQTGQQISEIGNFIQSSPLGLRNSVALYRSPRTFEYIILITMIDCYSKPYFTYPLREDGVSHADYTLELLEHYKTHFAPIEGKSDVHTYANIWNLLNTDKPSPTEEELYEWCQDHAIRYENMSEALSIAEDIIALTGHLMSSGGISNDLLNSDYDLKARQGSSNILYEPFDVNNVMNVLAPILAEIYQDRKLSYDLSNIIRVRYVGQDGKYYKIDSQTVNSIERDIPESIYGLITSTISSDYAPDFHTVACSLVL